MHSLRILGTAAVLPLITSCSMLGSLTDGAKDAAKAAKGCPDVGNLEAVAKIDFADEFGVEANAAAKVKAGVIAAADLKTLALAIDADLKTGCSGLAKDLGAPGTFKSGPEACKAAVKAMGDVKAKMGATAVIAVEVEPPVCSASLDAAADCAGKCDASVKGGKAEVKCEGGEISGICSADCTGKCALSANAACSGTCSGSCDATFSGTCSGTCDGTCDGKTAKGSCAGKCEGKCDSGANGTCGGKCGGSCELSSAGKCEGTCSGKCSVELKEPKCSGQIVQPKMSAECKATCDAHASVHMSCTKPAVAVKITGSADEAAASRYKAALEANLPRIVTVAVGMAPKLKDVAVNAMATLQGGIAAGQAVLTSRPTLGARVAACLVTPFKGAVDAAGNIQASVQVSVDVKASATASSSASSAPIASGKSG
jgi:hypothetical protein